MEENPGLETTEDPNLEPPEGMSLSEACPTHLKLKLGNNSHPFAGTVVQLASGQTYFSQDKMFKGCDVRDVTFDKLQSCKEYEIQVSSFEPRMEDGAMIMTTSPQVRYDFRAFDDGPF